MTGRDPTAARELLARLYRVAVERAHPSGAVPPHLPEMADDRELLVVGAGKAASAMAVATEHHYQGLAGDRLSGFVVTRHGFELPTQRLQVVSAGHPVPDEGSRSGAERALRSVAAAGADTLVLVLLSGGASALWSAPVPGVDLESKQDLTRELLKCGARISEINTVRRHLSRIKGGKLAAAAAGAARVLTLAISDVPGDEPAAIGSGPTVADPTTLADAREVLRRYGIRPSASIGMALLDPASETLKPGAAELARTEYRIVAAPKASLDAAAAQAAAAGYRVSMLGDALEGEAREVGRQHAELALAARRRGERLAILSGGELTVTVAGRGAGGPNQEYALGLAIALDGADRICALAADTDGIDGGGGNATDPAGALVLPDTLARARAASLDPAQLLANNDSTAFFRAIGDLVTCGPTQTNVNDFRCVLVDP